MKRHLSRLLLLCCVFCVTSYGEACWHEMDTGMDQAEVFSILGPPLIVHNGRGYVQWTYDSGGTVMFRQSTSYDLSGAVMFHHSTVLYWDTPTDYRLPLPVQAPGQMAAVTKISAPSEVVAAATVTTEVEREPTIAPKLAALAKLHPGNYNPHAEHLGSDEFVATRSHR